MCCASSTPRTGRRGRRVDARSGPDDLDLAAAGRRRDHRRPPSPRRSDGSAWATTPVRPGPHRRRGRLRRSRRTRAQRRLDCRGRHRHPAAPGTAFDTVAAMAAGHPPAETLSRGGSTRRAHPDGGHRARTLLDGGWRGYRSSAVAVGAAMFNARVAAAAHELLGPVDWAGRRRRPAARRAALRRRGRRRPGGAVHADGGPRTNRRIGTGEPLDGETSPDCLRRPTGRVPN